MDVSMDVFVPTFIGLGVVVVGLALCAHSMIKKLQQTIAAQQTQIDDLKRELEEVKGKIKE